MSFSSFYNPTFLVRTDDWNRFGQRLGNDLAIKGIAVMNRQRTQVGRVLRGARQSADLKIGDGLMQTPVAR